MAKSEEVFTLFQVSALCAVTVLMLYGSYKRVGVKAKEHRKLRSTTIVPQYEPPADLTPAMLSIVDSSKHEFTDISATFLHLAVRGAIRIDQLRPSKTFRRSNYQISWANRDVPMETYERALIDGFIGEGNSFTTDDIAQYIQATAGIIKRFRRQIGSAMVQKKLFRKSPTNTANKSGSWILAGLAALALILTISIYLWWTILMSLFATFLAYLFVMAAPSRSRYTQRGEAIWAEVQGFRLYLTMAEKDRLAFHNDPNAKQTTYSELLPYAVALGLGGQWASQFTNMNVSLPLSTWYGTVDPVNSKQQAAYFQPDDFAESVAASAQESVKQPPDVSASDQ